MSDSLQQTSTPWRCVRLSKVLRRVSDPIEPSPTEMYEEIGVRSHGKGIFHKEPVSGEVIGGKRVYRVHPHCFVFNVVFAWEQAVAKTTERECGMIASHRFPMYAPLEDAVDVDFLLLFFMTARGKHLLGLASPGGAGRNRTLSQSAFLDLQIPLPPISIQRQIAGIINQWSQTILAIESQIRLKRRRLKALMQQLLTGEIRLSGFGRNPQPSNCKVVTVPASIRQGIYPPSVQPGIPRLMGRPDGWSETTMGDVLEIQKRSVTLDPDEVYQLVVAKRNRGGIEPRAKLLGSEIKTPTQFRIHEGDFVISRRQIVHGACGVVPATLDGAIVSNEYSVCTVHDGLDITFLKYLSHTLYFQQTCFHSSVGVALEKMIFKIDKWLKMKFIIPPLDEQRAIAEVLTKASREVELLELQTTLLNEQKQGLIHQLVNGEVKITRKHVG